MSFAAAPAWVAEGLAFPEGPRWHDGRLWWSDMHGGGVRRLGPAGVETVCEVPGRPSGLGWLPDGRLLVVSMADRRVLRREPDGELVLHSDLSALAPRRCNDMVVDAEGGAYVGNFGFELDDREDPAPTVLIRVDPDGAARVVADDLWFPNGMVLAEEGRTLVVAETWAARLTAFDVAPDGGLSGRRLWAALDPSVFPDGICLDAEGAIWVASPSTSECLRVREGGEIAERLALDQRAYACALGGAEGRTLYVCLAGSHAPERQRRTRDGRIVAQPVAVAGAGLEVALPADEGAPRRRPRRHLAPAVSATLAAGAVLAAGLSGQAQPRAGIAGAAVDPRLQVAPPTPVTHPDGAALYAGRCAACHDHATGRVPSRQTISENPPGFILSALHGVMAPMVEGLSENDRIAIANHLSKSPPLQQVDPKKIWGDGVAGTPLDAPRCSGPTPPVDLAARHQWNGWSPTPDNARYQPRPGLAAADVPKLKLKWAFQYPGAKNGQAAVIGDRLYVTSMAGAVYALNARTGCVYWRHAADAATRTSVTVAQLPGAAGGGRALFYSDWTKSAVALDADTGRQLWKTIIDDQPGEQMTGSITYWNGEIFVPISSGNEAFAQSPDWECCRFRGALVALDAATGRVLWKRYTSDTVPQPFKVNAAGKRQWGPSGGSIWTTPTVDPKRGLIYVGTSNSYTDLPYDHADSVLAIDIGSGAIRWARQLTPHDNYIDGCWRTGAARPANCPSPVGPDFSIGASPILQHLKDGRDLVITGSKSGVVHALDPANGAPVWERRVGQGSELGGVEFGMAADAAHIYAGVSDIVARHDPRPGLYALDPATGRIVWSARNAAHPTCRWSGMWCSGAVSQAISVMPGAIFVGAYDGHFRAYDPKDGRVLWNFDTGGGPIHALSGKEVYGGVMDGAGATIAGGFVYVHSGYAGRSGATQGRDMRNADGNVLLAFAPAP